MIKKIFLLPIYVAFVVSFKQENNLKFIDKGIYKVWYSEEYRNPVKVVYSVYHFTENKDVNRKGLNFYSEKGIKTASSKDFAGNDYDKGHLCPAETFSSTKEEMKITFSYVNCSVQYYELNRGLWAKLEHLERKWSAQDSLIVTVELVFDTPVKKLPTGTAIPKTFKKNIHFYHANKTESYSFPNAECKMPLESYRINF
ncbi:MAG: DNA/RNA non-specific endonuclease [Bacteroidetes bacterium]|nr:DNA/RNA non-specific endonuclease [Bacteroidota bacterium]